MQYLGLRSTNVVARQHQIEIQAVREIPYLRVFMTENTDLMKFVQN